MWPLYWGLWPCGSPGDPPAWLSPPCALHGGTALLIHRPWLPAASTSHLLTFLTHDQAVWPPALAPAGPSASAQPSTCRPHSWAVALAGCPGRFLCPVLACALPITMAAPWPGCLLTPAHPQHGTSRPPPGNDTYTPSLGRQVQFSEIYCRLKKISIHLFSVQKGH